MKQFFFSYFFFLLSFSCHSLRFESEHENSNTTITLTFTLDYQNHGIGANNFLRSNTTLKKNESDHFIQNGSGLNSNTFQLGANAIEKLTLVTKTAKRNSSNVDHETEKKSTKKEPKKSRSVTRSLQNVVSENVKNEITPVAKSQLNDTQLNANENNSNQSQTNHTSHPQRIELLIPVKDQKYVKEYDDKNEIDQVLRSFSPFKIIQTNLSLLDYSKSNKIDPGLRESLENGSVDPPELEVYFFYLSYCSHCHRTAPFFIEASKALSCHRNIKFYAFDCHDRKPGTDEHMTFCNNLRIHSYPHIRVYAKYRKYSLVLRYENKNPLVTTVQRNAFVQWINTTCSLGFYDGCSAVMSSKELISSSTLNNQSFTIFSTLAPSKKNDLVPPVSKLVELANEPPNATLSILNQETVDKRYLYILNCIYRLLKQDFLSGLAEKDRIPSHVLTIILDVLMAIRNLLPGNNVRLLFLNFEQEILKNMKDGTLPVGDYKNLFKTHIELKKDFPLITAPFGAVFSDMWVLFHFLTISNHVLWQSRANKTFSHFFLSPSTESNDANLLSYRYPMYPEKMFKILKSVISRSLPCQKCRKHFSAVSSVVTFSKASHDFQNLMESNKNSTEPIIDDSKYLVLYFWRLHNLVTRRIFLDEIGFKFSNLPTTKTLGGLDAFVKNFGKPIQELTDGFPLKQECTLCYLSVKMNKTTPAEYFKLLNNEDVKGYNFTSPSSQKLDLLSDHFFEFHLTNTLGYLVKYYWKDEWFPNNVVLQWNNRRQAFDISDFQKKITSSPSNNITKHPVNQSSTPNVAKKNEVVDDKPNNINSTLGFVTNTINSTKNEMVTSYQKLDKTPPSSNATIYDSIGDIVSFHSSGASGISNLSIKKKRIRSANSTWTNFSSNVSPDDANNSYYMKPNSYQTITLTGLPSFADPLNSSTQTDPFPVNGRHYLINETKQTNTSTTHLLSDIFSTNNTKSDLFSNTPLSNEKLFIITKYLILICFICLAFLIVISVCHRTN